MKRIIFILMFILAASVNANSREVITLGREWLFSNTYSIAPSALSSVTIPHTYNYDATSSPKALYRGIANYIKNVEIPYRFRGKQIFLKFNGVANDADVFVNGRFAGEHKGGYTSFILNITDFVKIGSPNNIWVRVNNSTQFDYLPINGWFNQYGGLTRDVELVVTNHTHISLSENGSQGVFLIQTKVTDKKATVNAKIKLESQKPGTYSVELEVHTPENNLIVVSGETKVRIDKNTTTEIPIEIENPILWNGIRDTYLYDFVIKIKDEDLVIDSIVIPMGLRYYGIDPVNGFMLNGKPYKLNGATYIADRSTKGNALTQKDIDQDMDIILEIGANAIRMKGFTHDPYFYYLCDKYGIIIWSEIPFVGPEMVIDNGYTNKPSIKNSAKQQLVEMISQYYNNTSVLFWGLFSDITTRGDSPIPFIKELNELAHETDPTRLTIASSNQDGEINFITDLIGWSQYMGWKEGTVSDVNIWLAQLTKDWSHLKSAIGEYGAGGSILHQEDSLRRPNIGELKHPERWQTTFHEQYYTIVNEYPSIWASFVNSMFDYGSSTYTGGDTPGICDMGLVTYDRQTKKDAFYLYKANWNKLEPFVFIAEKRWDNRKKTRQTIKVFSNQSEVELVINGISKGQILGKNGVFKWENISLNNGVNTLEAYSGRVSDNAEIKINTQAL